MQHVPLKQRLTSCCLVNRRLHAAAVAATNQLLFLNGESRNSTWGSTTSIASPERAQSVLGWLDQYGEHLTYLSMSRFPSVQQLPCANLRELLLQECSVQLGPAADGTPGVIQCCTKLTRLDLSCSIIDAPAGAVVHRSLSSLLHLQSLSVWPRIQERDSYSVGGLSSSTLPRLKNLTHLSVRSLSIDNLAQLGGLTSLQALTLEVNSEVPVGPSSAPGLTVPASLTRLWVLSPVQAAFLSVVPVGLQCLHLSCSVEGPAEGPSSFLSGMARLQHLTSLDLVLRNGSHKAWTGPLPVLHTQPSQPAASLCA
jgi:hypothetical protein